MKGLTVQNVRVKSLSVECTASDTAKENGEYSPAPALGVVATHADWSPRLRACLDAARMASLCFIARARSDLIISLSDRCRHRTSQLKLDERLEDEDGVLEGVGGPDWECSHVSTRSARPHPSTCLVCKRLSVIGDIRVCKVFELSGRLLFDGMLSVSFTAPPQQVVVKSHTKKF